MTQEEKAKELIDEFVPYVSDWNIREGSKDCALIVANEIINAVKKYETKKGKLLIDNINLLYWEGVKQKIIKDERYGSDR